MGSDSIDPQRERDEDSAVVISSEEDILSILNDEEVPFGHLHSYKNHEYQVAMVPFKLENYDLNPKDIRYKFEGWSFIQPEAVVPPLGSKSDMEHFKFIWDNLVDRICTNVKPENRECGCFSYIRSKYSNRGSLIIFKV